MARSSAPREGGTWAPRRPPRPTLTREQIVAAAVRLADAEGIAALSLRRLAAELNAGAASLYWHVRDKDELLDLALDAVLAEVTVAAPADDWRADLEHGARELRAVLLEHPWALSVMLTRWSIGPHAMAQADAATAVLARAGFGGSDLYFAYSVLFTYVTGEVNQEVSWGGAPPPALAPPGDAQPTDGPSMLAALEALHDTEYPALRPIGAFMAGHDQDEQFQFGLEVVLDGLEHRLGTPARRR